jgi:hypothetical protein
MWREREADASDPQSDRIKNFALGVGWGNEKL